MLQIKGCNNLISLNGIHELTNLQHVEIRECTNLPSINSINELPHQTTLFKKIKKCGFKKGNFINLSSGIVVLYYAWKI